ncbi:hypothetical protein [Xanthomonas phage RTH11]|nr:hypothetical protein [Xanthomonas phage RTH11]
MSQNANPSTMRVDVICTPSQQVALEALLDTAIFRFPHSSVSLETQQLDEVQKQRDLADHHENIRKLLKAEKPTGVPHLFVLDPNRLADGDLESQATLQALANAHFSNSERAAVALLPPAMGLTTAGAGAVSLLKDGILADTGVTTLESIEAIRLHFLGPNGLIPSMEAHVDQKFLDTLFSEKGISHKPFDEQDIEFIETHMGRQLPSALRKFYADIGSFRADSTTVFAATPAMEETSKMARSNHHLPHTYFVFGRKVFKQDIGQIKAGDEFMLICDLKTGKAGYLSYKVPFVTTPSSALLEFIASLVHYND